MRGTLEHRVRALWGSRGTGIPRCRYQSLRDQPTPWTGHLRGQILCEYPSDDFAFTFASGSWFGCGISDS
jgi:hypothetical protein